MPPQRYFSLSGNAEAFIGEGRWFNTGDMGRLDTEGYLYLTLTLTLIGHGQVGH